MIGADNLPNLIDFGGFFKLQLFKTSFNLAFLYQNIHFISIADSTIYLLSFKKQAQIRQQKLEIYKNTNETKTSNQSTLCQNCTFGGFCQIILRVYKKINPKQTQILMNNNMSIEETAGQQNYGLSIPPQLIDSTWKKCLLNQQADQKVILEGIVRIRQYLSQSIQLNNLIANVLNTQVHKPLFKYGKKLYEKIMTGCASPDDVTCLHEIVWIFTNLCSGQKNTTNEILELGILNFCKELFLLQNYSQIISILFQLVGNLAGQINSMVKISFLSDANFYTFMQQKYQNYVALPNFHTNATWAFSNLFRDFNVIYDSNNIQNFEDLILGYYPIISNLLKVPSQEGKLNALYIFYYISKDSPFHVAETIVIIEPYLTDPSQKIRQLVVQIFGNFISECEQAVDIALNIPIFLNTLFQLLKTSPKTKFRREAAWTISNIFAGTVNQVQKFVSIPTLFNEIHHILVNEQQQGVIKQIVWSIANSYCSSSQKTFECIYYSSIIEPLCKKVRQFHDKIPYLVFTQGLLNYLTKFEKNPNLDYKIFLRNLGQIQLTLDYLLQYHAFLTEVVNNTIKAQQMIAALISRGPMTEEQLMHKHLADFKI